MTSKNFKIKNGLDIGDVADVITVSNGVATITGTVSSEGSSLGNIRIGVTTDNEIDTSSGNLTIDSAGGTVTVDDNLTVNGTLNDGSNNLTSTFAELNLIDGSSAGTIVNSKAVIYGASGEVNATTLQIGGSSITSTAAELNIMDGDTSATSTTLADADRVVVNDAGTMKQVALTDFETYFETALDTLSNVTTVGALNSGSITSGFGAIDNGSSNITTTGTITGGIGVFDNIRIDNTAGEIDTSSGNLTIDSAGGTVTVDDNLSVSGNATITGNLTVNGTTTTLNTTNKTISDALIELGNGTTGTPSNDAGIVIERGDSNNAFIGFDESADKFIVGTGTFTGASTGNLTITTGTLVANIEGTSANMSGTVTYGSLSDGTITVTAFVDEDNMASNSATLIPTQQSVKAYVDSSIGAISSTAISEGNSNVTVNDSGTGNVTVTVDGATHSVFAAAGITLSQGEFVGTATAAEYADLAERFHADAEYPRGTVMMMGGDHEVTICNVEACENIIGVVSDDAQAGFKMNTSAGTDATHPYIALAGRVDVKVTGTVAKGDRLISSGTPGVARAAQPGEATAFNVIGRALEDNDSNEITVIKAFVVANR